MQDRSGALVQSATLNLKAPSGDWLHQIKKDVDTSGSPKVDFAIAGEVVGVDRVRDRSFIVVEQSRTGDTSC
jgi:hypothetical protein